MGFKSIVFGVLAVVFLLVGLFVASPSSAGCPDNQPRCPGSENNVGLMSPSLGF
jgi:hypothetical protein